MTLFEYLSVSVSIVMALAIVRILTELCEPRAPESRYWVVTIFQLSVLINGVLFWWNFWAYREAERWSFPGFIVVMLVPGALYFESVALVPDRAREIASWRERFLQVHRRFFGAGVVHMLAVITASRLLLDVPLVHPLRGVQGLTIALCVAGLSSRSPRLHAAIAVALSVLLLLAIAIFFSQPGHFSAS